MSVHLHSYLSYLACKLHFFCTILRTVTCGLSGFTTFLHIIS